MHVSVLTLDDGRRQKKSPLRIWPTALSLVGASVPMCIQRPKAKNVRSTPRILKGTNANGLGIILLLVRGGSISEVLKTWKNNNNKMCLKNNEVQRSYWFIRKLNIAYKVLICILSCLTHQANLIYSSKYNAKGNRSKKYIMMDTQCYPTDNRLGVSTSETTIMA